MMNREKIISRIKAVQSLMDNDVNPLREKYDFSPFNFYWDIIEFLNWLRKNEPGDYDEYLVDDVVKSLEEFAMTYIMLIEPYRLEHHFMLQNLRTEDGVLNLDRPIEQMIRQLNDKVLNLQESELTSLNNQLESLQSTATLTEIVDKLQEGKTDNEPPILNQSDIDYVVVHKSGKPELNKPKPKKLTKRQLEIEEDERAKRYAHNKAMSK